MASYYSRVRKILYGDKSMAYVLWTIGCLVVYGAGLVILLRVTPFLFLRKYDEGLFMAIAAADIFGGIFAFGGVVIPYALYSGSFEIKLLDCFLLVGVFAVSISLAYRSWRPRMFNTIFSSRVATGVFTLLLAGAALYYIALLFLS
jgi:hypothetical protein